MVIKMERERRNASQSYYIDDDIQNENVPFSLNYAGEIYLSKGFKTYMPNGRNDYYLMYMTEGEMRIVIDGRESLLCEGGVVCMQPHTPYSYGKSEQDKPIRYYWVHFTGNECRRVLSECGLVLGQVSEIGKSQEISYYFEDIFSEFRKRRPSFDFSVTLKAQYLLLHIGRALNTEGNTSASPIEKSLKFIHTNIKRSFSVKELADMEFLSPSRYREVFKEATGHSPLEYILRQRIHLACELIEQGDISLSQVAELCGFSDRLYFQRVFKKRMAVTPGEYRAKLHNRRGSPAAK